MKTQNIFNLVKRLFIVMIMTIITGQAAFSQADRSMYFLPILPNVRTVNPAVMPPYKFYIGIPLLSSVKTGLENTFTYNDVFKEVGDSLYLDRDYLLSNLNDKNTSNFNLMEEFLSFGLQYKENYFHFRAAAIANSNVTLTKDLFRFLLYGNGSDYYLGKTIDFSGNALNLTYYTEYSLGYTRQIDTNLTVGANVKFLQGAANVYTEKLGISLSTDPDDFTLTAQSDILLHTSNPSEGEGFDPVDIFTNTGNSGFAIDLGGRYGINSKFTVAASLLNLGSIKWKNNVKTYKTEDPSKQVVFDGFDLGEFFENKDFNQDRIEEVLDSIADEFGIVETEESYKSRLPTTLFLNLDYHHTPKDQFGFVFGSQFLEERLWPTATLAYTRKFNKDINLMASYSIAPKSYFNLGVGFAANLGPFQLYLINEGVTAPFSLVKARFYVIRFGFNLVFGELAVNKKPPVQETTE